MLQRPKLENWNDATRRVKMHKKGPSINDVISKRAIVDLLPSLFYSDGLFKVFLGVYLPPQNDVVYGWPQGLKRENIYKMNGNKFGTIRKLALKNLNSIVLYPKTDLKNGKIRHNLVRWYPYRISYRDVGNGGTKRDNFWQISKPYLNQEG